MDQLDFNYTMNLLVRMGSDNHANTSFVAVPDYSPNSLLPLGPDLRARSPSFSTPHLPYWTTQGLQYVIQKKELPSIVRIIRPLCLICCSAICTHASVPARAPLACSATLPLLLLPPTTPFLSRLPCAASRFMPRYFWH